MMIMYCVVYAKILRQIIVFPSILIVSTTKIYSVSIARIEKIYKAMNV
jgi:hypothetical protein